MMIHAALRAGNVAVISGSAYGGIGWSFAKKCAVDFKMKVVLADNAKQYLEKAGEKLKEAGVQSEDYMLADLDVTQMSSWSSLADNVFQRFGTVDVLHLNAGTGVQGSTCWTNLDAWHKTLNVNLFGVIYGAQAFVGRMIEKRSRPGLVICTGSKQGITAPPGNACVCYVTRMFCPTEANVQYNVSKAGVKAFTEQLAHELRNKEDSQTTAHLLIPGWVFTKLTSENKSAEDGDKPAGAWTADQTVDYMLEKLAQDEFYIICPDNDVTENLDRARMQWSAQDVALRRPALSRWHPDYKEEFEAHIKRETSK